MTNNTPLSPVAQAVLDAVYAADREACAWEIAAAALRAAADQVVPENQSTHRNDGPLVAGDMLWDDTTASTIRRRLLAIAAEIERFIDGAGG